MYLAIQGAGDVTLAGGILAKINLSGPNLPVAAIAVFTFDATC